MRKSQELLDESRELYQRSKDLQVEASKVFEQYQEALREEIEVISPMGGCDT